jgi:endoglycosylceramidase
MRRLLVLAVLLLALPSTASALEPLRATRGGDPAIVDGTGRQVLLRGVNVNQLGDYHQDHPDLEPVIPLTEQDFGDIAALGFNSVRLILSWSALQPERGALDAAYVAGIHDALDQARAHGLYVVLDMHQDAWGKYIATPPGEGCPPGLQRAIGWDGAPAWATLTDGLTTCRFQIREIAPAVGQAWQGFWVDREGIQGQLVGTWAALAREFAGEPAVAGYDLINEPNTGYLVGANSATLMARYYTRALDAIRAAEASVEGGFSHTVFFEPSVVWSGFGADALPPPTFTADANVVFAPHLYAESITVDSALGLRALSVEDGFRLARAAADTYGTAFWSGEWGWFGDPAANRPLIEEYARQEDRHLVGGAWWSWKQACGDPHVIGSPGSQPGAVSPSLNRYACPEQTPLGIPETTRRVLSRPYARAAPGRLVSLDSDPASGAVRVSGRDSDPAGSCRLEVWVPDDGSGMAPALAGTNVSDVTVSAVPGGWLASACASGDYELRRAAAS